jgi:hypothetical protein
MEVFGVWSQACVRLGPPPLLGLLVIKVFKKLVTKSDTIKELRQIATKCLYVSPSLGRKEIGETHANASLIGKRVLTHSHHIIIILIVVFWGKK